MSAKWKVVAIGGGLFLLMYLVARKSSAAAKPKQFGPSVQDAFGSSVVPPSTDPSDDESGSPLSGPPSAKVPNRDPLQDQLVQQSIEQAALSGE